MVDASMLTNKNVREKMSKMSELDRHADAASDEAYESYSLHESQVTVSSHRNEEVHGVNVDSCTSIYRVAQKKVSHYRESSLNRIKSRHSG